MTHVVEQNKSFIDKEWEEAQNANARYNEMRYYGLFDSEEQYLPFKQLNLDGLSFIFPYFS